MVEIFFAEVLGITLNFSLDSAACYLYDSEEDT